MAKRSLLLCTILLAAVAGCETGAVTQSVPQPNFNAPVITAAPAPVVPMAVYRPAPLVAPSIPSHSMGRPANIPVAWIPNAPARPWKWIIIHHSDTPTGCAAKFDAAHRAKGWDELGYHFVIGNGTESGDGQVEVGPRWPKQKWGAHDKTPDNRYNDYGIGICLVGNFMNTQPTRAQVQSVAKLVAYLMRTYNIPPDHVLGHGDTKATDCPGRNMNVAVVRRMATQMMADSGFVADEKTVAAAQELLQDVPPADSH